VYQSGIQEDLSWTCERKTSLGAVTAPGLKFNRGAVMAGGDDAPSPHAVGPAWRWRQIAEKWH